MATLTMLPQTTVRKHITYLAWQDLYDKVKPYQVLMDVPPGRDKSNLVFEEGPKEDIVDIRGRESEFNMDDNGLMVKTCKFDIGEYNTETLEGEGGYLEQVADLIRETVEVSDEVVCFNWQVCSGEGTPKCSCY